MNNQWLKEFMASHPLMVISTLNAVGNPQSATVGFGSTDELELVFGTSRNSRKAGNILNNSKVAAVIGWDKDGTVQYEGTASLVAGADIETYSELYFAKNPMARGMKDKPGMCYFLIKPTWIRFTDVTKNPWLIKEIKL